jgi:two-component system, OmpR family, phosphate regulon sensor histidine kinase PhoR
MNSSLRKVIFLIIAILVLPLLIFSVFEIGNFKRNEKVIQNIYKNQLDAILYSINQYSDDILSTLVTRIENSSNDFNGDSGAEFARIFGERPSLKSLAQFDTTLTKISSLPDLYTDNSLVPEMITLLKNNSKTIKQLQTYLRGGYRKVEPIGSTNVNLQWIVFLTHIKDKEIINVLVIDPEQFIKQVLDPKIQQIAKGKFDIAAYRSGEALPFYTSNKQNDARKINNKAPFWLLTNYFMGIELKDATIADLTKDRVKRNLLVIGFMDLILLFGVWLIFRNVTKQVELSQLKSDFVSSVSHEIRTPLALITMYIETLEMGRMKDAKKIQEYYSIILNETRRLSGIVNRILTFSRIESNKRKYAFSYNDLNEIVESSAQSFCHSIENNGFTYSFIPEKNLPPIQTDKEAITDALVNLVDNAIKYSTDIKDIVIRTGKSDNYVFVEVEDHGIGISEKNQKYIFDKFYRVSETNLANKVKGSGLGLAIVKHIMDAHSGKIFVKSTPGTGSLFRLSFPIK